MTTSTKAKPATELPWLGITHTKDGWSISVPWQSGRYETDKDGSFLPYGCDIYNSQYLNGGINRDGALSIKISGYRTAESCWHKAQEIITAYRRANSYSLLVADAKDLYDFANACYAEAMRHAPIDARLLLVDQAPVLFNHNALLRKLGED